VIGGDDEDGSDWLSNQFDATEQVPAQPVVPAHVTPPAAKPPVVPAPAAPSVAAPFPFKLGGSAKPTEPVTPTPVAPTPVAPTPVAPTPVAPTAPTVTPPPTATDVAPVASTPSIPSASTPNAGGGFAWGLKPGGAVDQPPAIAGPPVAVPPAVAAPPVAAPPVAAPPAAAPPVAPPALVIPPPRTHAAPPTEPSVAPPAEPSVAPPTEPYVAPPTEPYVSEPTQPLSWDEFASTQQQSTPPPTPTSAEQPTEAYTVPAWMPAATSPADPAQHPVDATDPTSAIDSLFGEHKFQEYDELGVRGTIQVPPVATVVEPDLRLPHEPLSGTQRVLMAVAGGLVAALILVGLFFLGQHLGTAAAIAPIPKATGAASSATPTPAGTGGPAAPGVQKWTALQGGECIQPFSSAWAITFTVVACTADHDAEMVFKGTLPETAEAKYPSATAFQTELTPLCSAPTSINYAAAASVTDLQVSFSYPPNTASWLKGDRTYYCFVDRVSGGNLPGDLAVPKTK
jgi:Septum formation